MTWWFEPGVHYTPQIQPGSGSTFVGAPGAVLDGRDSVYGKAFAAGGENVTIRHLTITGFMAPGDEGVVNQDLRPGWTVERNTIHRNGGAGALLGDNNRLALNCLADNSQYGFQGFGKNLTIDQNEIARNNTYDWERNQPGCGCSGGSKFWSSGPGKVTNNWVHDNYNVGLWWDNNNQGYLIEGNLIEGNHGHGIFYETSYNFRIANNTFRRNAIQKGQAYQAVGDRFPTGAIYISEAGGDSRVSGGLYAQSEVTGNVFEDNWAGVVLWENPDRFGHDGSANTSKGYTTLPIDPKGDWGTTEMWKCGDPAAGGLINTQPYYWDCRWRTMNVAIHNNDFRLSSKAAIGCTTNLCSQQAVFSGYGTYPSWSPYKGTVIQDAITFNQNNRWYNNRYSGEWHFVAWDRAPHMDFASWQAAPYNQDVGSSYNGATTSTTTTAPTTTTSAPTTPTTAPGAINHVDADTSTLTNSLGRWVPWYSADIRRVELYSDQVLEVKVNAADGWGVSVDNWPGFTAGPGPKTVRFSAGSNTPRVATLIVRWKNSSGADLGVTQLSTPPLASGWHTVSTSAVAPNGTTLAYLELIGTGNPGDVLQFDDFYVGR